MPKLTGKRQVTVPQSVCEAMGLKPGDYVEIFEHNGVAHIVKMNNKSLAGQFAHLAKGNKIPSPGSLKKALKAKAAKRFAEAHDSG
jgi:AbrB family looped-hinge helix DNA binding protein